MSENYWFNGLSFIGVSITASIVVFLIQYFGVYDEIQSWQIAYLTWAFSFSLLCFAQSIVTYIKGGQNFADEVDEYWNAKMLQPFGIKANDAGSTSNWSFVLVACAPAIVFGYLANFILEEKFILSCSKNLQTDICNDDVCCELVSSHTDWIVFLVQLASSSLAAWGFIRYVGLLLLQIDEDVVTKDETQLAGAVAS